MNRADADKMLGDMGLLIGLPGLRFDQAGLCELIIDGRWRLSLLLQASRGRVYLHCPISSPSAEAGREIDEGLLRLMLQANFMGRGAAGASLALGPDGRACLQAELPLSETHASALVAAIERLLAMAEIWATRLLGPAPAATPRARPRPSFRQLA